MSSDSSIKSAIYCPSYEDEYFCHQREPCREGSTPPGGHLFFKCIVL